MNWTTPHPPATVTPPAVGSDGSTSGGGGTGSSTTGKSSASTSRPGEDDDPDYNYVDVPSGQDAQSYYAPPAKDQLEVETDDLIAYEQNILTAASNLVSTFNELRDRAQGALDEQMWGKGEGHWALPERPSSKQTSDTTDYERHFVRTDSAIASQQFTDSMHSAQQSALQNAADMITLSGMFIEALDSTVNAYAGMDQLSVFPDPQQLKNLPD